jgi:hypothetical protein
MSLKLKYNISSYDRLRINFWGIPKCMNTAAKYALLHESGIIESNSELQETDIGVEYHKENLNKYLDPKQALENGYENVTITRHPYGRVISLYQDFGLRRKASPIPHNCSFDEFIKFISKQPVETQKANVHVRSQCYFITDSKDNILPENVLTVSNYPEFFANRGIEIQVINKTEQSNIILTSEHKEIIRNVYHRDFQLLNFKG